jgi:hypothetical protein
MVGSTDKLGGGASDGDSTIARRLQRLPRDTAASNKEQQHKHDRGYIAQAPNLTRHPYGVSQKYRAYLIDGHLLRPTRIGIFLRSFRLHSPRYARETIVEICRGA